MSYLMWSLWSCWFNVNKWNNWMCNLLLEAEEMCYKLVPNLKTFVFIRLNQTWQVTREVNLNAPECTSWLLPWSLVSGFVFSQLLISLQVSKSWVCLSFVFIWRRLWEQSVDVAQIKDYLAHLHENNNLITGNKNFIDEDSVSHLDFGHKTAFFFFKPSQHQCRFGSPRVVWCFVVLRHVFYVYEQKTPIVIELYARFY